MELTNHGDLIFISLPHSNEFSNESSHECSHAQFVKKTRAHFSHTHPSTGLRTVVYTGIEWLLILKEKEARDRRS